MFLAASIVTMRLTPAIMELSPRVAAFFSRQMKLPTEEEQESASALPYEDHLIIVGFGIGGKHLARTARRAGIPTSSLK
ncbi:MAG: hypothetical protein V8Q84_10325 [Bilophila sp.]